MHGTHYDFVLLDEFPVCGSCGHSRIERHTGDEQRVCWVHKAFGLVVADDHFCGYWKQREACQADGNVAVAEATRQAQGEPGGDVTRPLYELG